SAVGRRCNRIRCTRLAGLPVQSQNESSEHFRWFQEGDYGPRPDPEVVEVLAARLNRYRYPRRLRGARYRPAKRWEREECSNHTRNVTRHAHGFKSLKRRRKAYLFSGAERYPVTGEIRRRAGPENRLQGLCDRTAVGP